jgi:ligand-binding sensor domain-containing protein
VGLFIQRQRRLSVPVESQGWTFDREGNHPLTGIFMNHQLHISVFLFLVVCIAQTSAQHPGWTNYTSGNSVGALAVADGNVWCGTRGGLVEIDRHSGQRTFYNHANSVLPDNKIQCLAIDSGRNIWAGTKNGLVKYDGRTWTLYTSANSQLKHNNVTQIIADTAGGVWLIDNGESVISINGADWKVYSTAAPGFPNVYMRENPLLRGCPDYSQEPSTLPENAITNIALDRKGGLWVFTLLGDIVINDGIRWRKFHYEEYLLECKNADCSVPEVTFFSSLAEDRAGNRWVATGCGLGKLCGKTIRVPVGTCDKCKPSIVIDSAGHLWAIDEFNEGIYEFDGKRGTFYPIKMSTDSYDTINVIAIDADNRVWVGTNKGLLSFDGKEWKFYNTSNSSLNGDVIQLIEVDNNNKKWIVNSSDGVFDDLVTFDDSTWETFGTEEIVGGKICCIAFESIANCWVGTNSGLTKYDGKKWTVFDGPRVPIYIRPNSVYIKKSKKASASIASGNTVFSIHFGKNDNKWMSAVDALVKYNDTCWTTYGPTNSKFPKMRLMTVFFKSDSAHDSFARNFKYIFSQEYQCEMVNDSNFWISYSNKVGKAAKLNVVHFDGDTTWNTFSDTLRDGYERAIWAMAVDSSENLWLGTQMGAVRYHQGKWDYLDTSNSALPSNEVRAIRTDTKGVVWLGTDEGLVSFDGKRWTRYDKANSGLPGNKIRTIAFDKKGAVWVGTDKGLASYVSMSE